MAIPTIPTGITVREMAHWRFRTSTFTPGRAFDGRQQFISVENRTWEAEYGVIGAWDHLMGQWIAFLDQVGGPKTSFLVPVSNALTITYGGDQTAFWSGLGFTAQEISDGFQKWSDDTTFSDGTGWALPDYGDPTVYYSAPAGATILYLNGFLGRNLAVGAYFAINNFLYRVESNDDGRVKFNPPLREAVAAGDTVVVNAPNARVRFPDDDAYRAAIEIRRYYGPYRLALIEAFDR